MLRFWKEQYGASKSHRHWTLWEENGFVCAHHNVFPEFTLRGADAENQLDSNHEWTRGEIATDDNHSTWFELRCHQTLLRRIHHVSFDNHKKSMVAPAWKPVGKGRFYFTGRKCRTRGATILGRARRERRFQRVDDSRRRQSGTRGASEMAPRTQHTRHRAWGAGRVSGMPATECHPRPGPFFRSCRAA